VEKALAILPTLTDKFEVIVIDDGSSDGSQKLLRDLAKKYPNVFRPIFHRTNRGYGGALRDGFKSARYDLIFYTDGDAQYHLEEDLPKLAEKQIETGADVVNGYKKDRGDNLIRTFLGNGYAFFSRLLFRIPIRDTDCDFRLIRKIVMNNITLESKDASILPEMIKKLEMAGAKFVEVPVNHYEREYGKSSYTAFGLLKEKLIGDIKLFLKMRKLIKK